MLWVSRALTTWHRDSIPEISFGIFLTYTCLVPGNSTLDEHQSDCSAGVSLLKSLITLENWPREHTGEQRPGSLQQNKTQQSNKEQQQKGAGWKAGQ